MHILFAPYNDPQDELTFLGPIEMDRILMNTNLVEGVDLGSLVVMWKLKEDQDMVLAIYGKDRYGPCHLWQGPYKHTYKGRKRHKW